MTGIVDIDMTINVNGKRIPLEIKDESKIGSAVDFIIVTDDIFNYARIIEHSRYKEEVHPRPTYNIPEFIVLELIECAYKEGYNQYEIVEAGLEPFDKTGYAKWKIGDLTKYRVWK
jgi:hypothetical protein